MTGLNILVHSIRLLFRNFAPALRISFVVLAVISALNVTLTKQMFAGMEAMDPANLELLNGPKFPWAIWTITILASVVGYLWVAVAWHRFILLEENPGAFLPHFNGAQMFAYFVKGILVGLILIALMIPMILLMSIMVGTMGGVLLYALFVPALFTIPATFIVYRLGMVLPAAAIGKKMTFSQSWVATKPHSGAILVLTIVVALVYLAFGFLSLTFGMNAASVILSGGSVTLFTVVNALVNWVSVMVGVSILTTLYGTTVEGRELG
jgi:hypothetical protein